MFVSIDLGGTKTRIAATKDLKSISRVEKYHTADNLKEQQEIIFQGISKVSDGEKLDKIVVGIPGTLDQKNRVFSKVPHLKYLDGLCFDELLPQVTSSPPRFFNDAYLAAYGESVHGAGRDHARVFYLTLSTGVGGTLIYDKKHLVNNPSLEPGHMIIYPQGRLNKSCGQSGCFESYCAGGSFAEVYGVPYKDCHDAKVWERYAYFLHLGIINILSLTKPDIIVIGGRMAEKYNHFYKPLFSYLQKEPFFTSGINIVTASFEDNSGLMGGISYLSSTRWEQSS